MSWQLYKKWYLFMFEVQMTLVSRRAEILGNECYNESRSIVNKSQVSFLQLRTVHTRKQVWVFLGFLFRCSLKSFESMQEEFIASATDSMLSTSERTKMFQLRRWKHFQFSCYLHDYRHSGISPRLRSPDTFFSSQRWSMSMLKSSRWLITNKTILPFTYYSSVGVH